MTTKKNEVPRKKRVASLSAGTEKQKMMQTETARGKDNCPQPHTIPSRNTQEFRTFWDHVNGGELNAMEARKARRLEVESLNKMKVVERVPYSFIKHRIGHEGQSRLNG